MADLSAEREFRDLPCTIEIEYSDRVNFAMQQHAVPLVDEVRLTNRGDVPLDHLTVTVSLENDECSPWSGRLTRIEPDSTVRVVPDGLTLSGRALALRTEAERTSIIVDIEAGTGRAQSTFAVNILAFDEWPGAGHYPELTASFVTPNHPRIADLLGAARQALAALGEADGLDGYQSGSRQRAARIAEACFNAAHSRGIGYINPPASFESAGQRVRLVDRLFDEQLGTCLDLSLLLAGAWEQCGLHPLILLPEGHAMPAIWTHDAHLAEAAIDEPARVRNLIELGEIVPVEATMLTHGNASFAAAVAEATRRLQDPGATFCAIDVRSARKRGIRPLPLRDEAASETDPDAHEAASVAAPGTHLASVALAERAEASGGGEAEPAETPNERIQRWQTRLLDLSLRNRLLNFRETGRTVHLQVPDVAQFEDMLAAGSRFQLYPKTDQDTSFLSEELAAGHVYSDLATAELQKRLLTLFRTARSGVEETGANLLHLAVGMLRWFESENSEQPRMAPLILLPAEITRRATGSGYAYSIALTDEPLRPNVTLLEKLRNEFGIDTTALEAMPEDESGIDVPLILRNFREAIRDSQRWEVDESVHIGLFSFNKFLMWRDLQDNLDRLRASRLVAHLVERPGTDFDSLPFPSVETLDDDVSPDQILCTRDADSSQLTAVRAASTGRTFVLEGPPGTGKSQTIANVIANSLAHGKRVLFVAEKMAALSVVAHRLKQDGLGPFCLELHSAKASKKQVLAQLAEALHAAEVAEPADWDQMCRDLDVTRAQLNDYVRALHQPRETSETLYQVLGRLSLLGPGPVAALPRSDIEQTTRDELRGWRLALTALMEASDRVDPIETHALHGIGQADWSFDLPGHLSAALDKAIPAQQAFEEAATKFCRVARIETAAPELSQAALEHVVAAAGLLGSVPAAASVFIGSADAAALRNEARTAIELGRQRDGLRRGLTERYREEFLELEHLPHIDAVRRAAAQPWIVRIFTGRSARKALRAYATGELPGLDQLGDDLEVARDVKRASADLAGRTALASALGTRWNGGEADWDALESLVDWCDRFAAALEDLPAVIRQGLAATVGSSDAAAAAAEVVAADAAWQQAWDAAAVLLAPTEHDRAAPGWLAGLRVRLERWRGGLGDLNDWCAWRTARDAAVEAGLGAFVERFEAGELARTDICPAFERSYGVAWFNATANDVEALRGFNADRHAHAIERFRELDQKVIADTRHVVTARIKAAAPTISSTASSQSEVGVLRRELEKKRRHLPTRRLIEEMPTLLPRLKPCFLMSPLSVAQFLDTKLPPFDLVVFDEASQIPVWDAIGAIARGTDVVVVGDSKQLPPTSFFHVLDGEDDLEAADDVVEDMESILKECNASGIPGLRLRWHYRSRHESLIAFSNHHYYENELHTFPSPEERSATLGVTFRHVPDGVYDRGGSRTNRIEAERVCDAVIEMLDDPETSDSIGIVTFNQAQQSLIEDLLDERRRERPELEPHFTAESEEPVFVKNLENVQGDERDAIIFSVGYGPDSTGRASMNFGPLNKEGGERRLNVAVTRARRRLIVFSSLRADQIDLRRTRAVGVMHFKTFLDYADRGPRALAEAVTLDVDRGFDSDFERAVCKALEDRGHKVDLQVGCAGYRIDLAIVDPERPGRYLIGIECDGAAYHSAKTARDRDRIRQGVLEGLGWRIARVWSTDWHVRRERCIEALEAAIEAARTAPHESPVVEVVRNETVQHASAAPLTIPEPKPLPTYVVARGGRGLANMDIYQPATIPTARRALATIVSAEEPITRDLLVRRLADWFGISSIHDRFREHFAELEQVCESEGTVRIDGDVFWSPGADPATYRDFRVAGSDATRRDVEDIPLVERVNAVVHVVEAQFGLPRDELQREVVRLFGFRRSSARLAEAVDEGIAAALATGRIAETEDRITVVG